MDNTFSEIKLNLTDKQVKQMMKPHKYKVSNKVEGEGNTIQVKADRVQKIQDQIKMNKSFFLTLDDEEVKANQDKPLVLSGCKSTIKPKCNSKGKCKFCGHE